MNLNAQNANQTAAATPPVADESRALQSFVPPQVNIYETKTGYVLEADLPGVTKEGLDISLDATTLTLSARRAKNTLTADPIYRESITADYRRVFELDPAIDRGAITAKLDQGVLTVTLPKSEQAKPRKIAVGD